MIVRCNDIVMSETRLNALRRFESRLEQIQTSLNSSYPLLSESHSENSQLTDSSYFNEVTK